MFRIRRAQIERKTDLLGKELTDQARQPRLTEAPLC
jgi:hypothetical protein